MIKLPHLKIKIKVVIPFETLDHSIISTLIWMLEETAVHMLFTHKDVVLEKLRDPSNLITVLI